MVVVNDLVDHWVRMGIYFGYSEESIIDFCLECEDITLSSQVYNIIRSSKIKGLSLEDFFSKEQVEEFYANERRLTLRSLRHNDIPTGYIKAFSEISTPYHKLVNGINRRRYHPDEFPNDEFEDCESPSQYLYNYFKTNIEYRYKVLNLLYKIYEMY